MTIADGIYRIASVMLDGMNFDSYGATKNQGANINLYEDNDTSAQKIYVKTSGNVSQMRLYCSNMMIDAQGAVMQAGTNVMQHPENGTIAQDWIIDPYGDTVLSNGVEMPQYVIRCGRDRNYVCDAEGAKAKNTTNIMIYPYHGDANHRWVFHKTSVLDSKMAVPANVGVASSVGGELVSRVATNANESVIYPCWTAKENDFQLRYRYRSRAHDANEFGPWSYWFSPTGSKDDDGFGDAWSANVTDERDGAVRYLTSGINTGLNGLTGADAREYQIEVRQFNENAGDAHFSKAHGNSNTGTVFVSWKPTVTVSSCTYGFDGILMPYSVDMTRPLKEINVVAVKVDGVNILGGKVTRDYPLSTGTYKVPLSALSAVPSDGATVTVVFETLTDDGIASTSEYTGELSYNGSYGLTMNVTQATADGYRVKVDVGANYSESGVYIVYESPDGETKISAGEKFNARSYLITPPFNTDYSVIACASDSAGHWAVRRVDGLRVNSRTVLFNFGADWFEMDTFIELEGGFSRSITPESEAYSTNGRKFESIFFGLGSVSKLSISGAVFANEPDEHKKLKKFRELCANHYAVVRNSFGERYEVAIVSYEDSVHAIGVWEVSMTMRERS